MLLFDALIKGLLVGLLWLAEITGSNFGAEHHWKHVLLECTFFRKYPKDRQQELSRSSDAARIPWL